MKPLAQAMNAIGTPDHLTIAVAEAVRNGRAMPLAPADMALARPDLWATAKAVERFLEVRTGDRGFGGFKTLIGAWYRKGLRGRWSAALVPVEGGRVALEAIVGPVAAYQAIATEQTTQPPPAAEPPADVADVPAPPLRPALTLPSIAAQRAQLTAIAQRLELVRPKRVHGVR